MRVRVFAYIALIVALAGCTTPTATPPEGGTSVRRSNGVIAQEFLDLVFKTESGQTIPRLLRYDGPVTVSISGSLSAYRDDLAGVIQRISESSRIDISLVGGNALIRVQQVPAAALRRAFPTAACFVAPGVSTWAEYLAGNSERWSRQQRLTRAAIFIPDNAAPYVVRACLNEELAQSLGPVNDLYRVSGTVFNDDNVFNALTPYDLLILRVLYDPRLSTGMGRAAAAPLVGRILNDVNPSGRRDCTGARDAPNWETLIETAMIGANPRARRRAAAAQAIAAARPLGDHRLVHSLLVYGRLYLRDRPDLAAPAFQEAYALALQRLGPDDLRTALAAMHMSAIALASGRYDDMLTIADPALRVARRFGDPVLISGLQGLRALALQQLGRNAEAERARRESLSQARYAFGPDAARIANAQAEIANLIPGSN